MRCVLFSIVTAMTLCTAKAQYVSGLDGIYAAGNHVGGDGIYSSRSVGVSIIGSLLLEDGSSFLLLEDASSHLCLEGGC